MLFQGNVVITYKNSTLRADRVRYDTATSEAWAEGNVRLNRADQEWVAPSAYYNFDTHVLKTDHWQGFFDPVYVRGDHLETVSSNHYSAVQASVTTCDYDQPHFGCRRRMARSIREIVSCCSTSRCSWGTFLSFGFP